MATHTKGQVIKDWLIGHTINELYQAFSLSKPNGVAFRDSNLTIMEDMTDTMEDPGAFMGGIINRGEIPSGAVVLDNNPAGELKDQV